MKSSCISASVPTTVKHGSRAGSAYRATPRTDLVGIADAVVLDTFGQAAAEFARRERLEDGWIDQHGDRFRLSDAMTAGPVVLVFLRGFG